MQTEKHISELLYEHDCVIIPGFGGIVCNYSSAQIDSVTHRFEPPFKKISFNRNLKNNDGLLAHRISMSEKISYSEANTLIAEFVNKLDKGLAESNRTELKNVGVFYSGKENTIWFEQEKTINYLPDAFGLKTFYSSSIKREPIERKIEKKLKDKIIVPSKERVKYARKKKTLPYLIAAASLLAVIFLFWVPFQSGWLRNIDYSGLNFFAAKEKPLYHSSQIVLPESNIENKNAIDAFSNDTLRYISILPDEKTSMVVQLKEEAEGIAPLESNLGIQKKYHIIGGAFAVPANAQRLKNKLIKQGFASNIIRKKNSVLRFVAYQSFDRRADALAALRKIRPLQGDVWLMKN